MENRNIKFNFENGNIETAISKRKYRNGNIETAISNLTSKTGSNGVKRGPPWGGGWVYFEDDGAVALNCLMSKIKPTNQVKLA